MIADGNKLKTGALFSGRLRAHASCVQTEAKPEAQASRVQTNTKPANEAVVAADSSSHKLAFAGLFVFTLLLYARPQELFSQALGELPLVKIVAIATLIAYAGGKLSASERFTIWPLEMKMLAVIVFLGIILTPIAFSPQRSITLLTDTFFKVITIFVLMVNLITTRRRLHSIMKLVVFCGLLLALVTIKNFLTGSLDVTHFSLEARAEVGNTFDNTNELALTLDLLLPFAVVFAITSKGAVRFWYSLCAAIIAMGAIITFSRGGFLGLVSMGGVLLWKLGRGKRVTTALAALVLVAAFMCVMPSGYSDRLFTILHPQTDKTNSAQERQMILQRGLEVALHHPIIGIGLANFYEYSPNGKVAHNSYIEIAAELGWIGLLAYLTFLIAPLRLLRRIERGTVDADQVSGREAYYFSVGLQAVMIAFMVCSFFASSQYFWHPYYIVGYSIALRRIHAADVSANEANARTEAASTFPSGALWKITRQPKGAA